jgi:hypothetical protein
VCNELSGRTENQQAPDLIRYELNTHGVEDGVFCGHSLSCDSHDLFIHLILIQDHLQREGTLHSLTNTGVSRGGGVSPRVQGDPKCFVPQTLVTGAVTRVHVEEYTSETHLCQDGNLWREIYTVVL